MRLVFDHITTHDGMLTPIMSDSDVQKTSPMVNMATATYTALRRLTLTNFRNYTSARLDLDPCPVILTGENGAGKTNLLEAISLLTPGRGIRGAKTDDLFSRSSNLHQTKNLTDPPRQISQWAIAATLEDTKGCINLGTGCTLTGHSHDSEGHARRKVRINGVNVSNQAALADHLAVIWLTPQMNHLFLEGGSTKRRFLDRLIYAIDPAHAGRLSSYEKTLRHRSRLLKETNGTLDPVWINTLEAQIAERGLAITAARQDLVERLAYFLAEEFGPFPGAKIKLSGQVETWLAQKSALAAEDLFRETLRENRLRDSQTGGSSIGPHRTELLVHHQRKGLPADQCSTGEQKALLIALVLAHARLLKAEQGKAPLLLFDEIAAHLDHQKRAALFDVITAHTAQSWMTGTDINTFIDMRRTACAFRIENTQLNKIFF